MAFRGASIVNHKEKLILFGGCKDFDCYNKVYSFDTKMKTLFEIVAKGTVPNARQGHCVIKYGQEMIIIGGNNEEGFLNDIYSLDLEHFIWQKLQPDNPMDFTGRTGHSCVMDDIQRIIIFGGRKINGLTDD
jgi:N-acetylneuraminic acid mutarotase